MALIEITTFSLRPDADTDRFLAADRRVQTEAVPRCAGFVRRTTARSPGGQRWLVLTLWRSSADALAAAEPVSTHAASIELHAFVEPGSITVERFETLE